MALSNLGELSLFKKRSQGAREFEALLDLLPHPTLVVEARSGQVLLGNARATELSAYTRKELSELELGTLLPGFALKQLSRAAEDLPAELVKRSSASLKVVVDIQPLGGSEGWTALSLQAAAQVRQRSTQAKTDEQRWQALHMLSLAAQQKELASTYRRILQAGHMLTGAEHLALYTPGQDGSLTLESVWGSGFDFPTQLAHSNLSHLRTPALWQQGKAVKAPLHKVAEGAGLMYLASTPLDLTQPDQGLLVAADGAGAPSQALLTMLQILAATATTAALNRELNLSLQARMAHLADGAQLSQQLQDNMQDGLLYFDRDLQLLGINPAAETMLGYTSQEAQGRHASDILISTRSLLTTLEEAQLENKLADVGDVKLHHRDGSDFLARVRIVSIGTQGKSERVAVLITDLSEHEAFHLQAQQLQQRAWLGDVTSIFAHEIRNPINNISTALQLMLMDLEDDDPLYEQVERMQEDCTRLEDRMNSLQSASRSVDHRPKTLDIGEFSKLQLQRWRARMERNQIQGHIQVAEDTPAVYADPRTLDQVFTNLLTNGIQAMEGQDGGVLAVKINPARDDDKLVEVRISDSGLGIPQNLQARIFDPFFTTKDKEGTGLGLAISRRIAMAHKGDLVLEQSLPGATIFKLTLPVAEPSTRQADKDEAHP